MSRPALLAALLLVAGCSAGAQDQQQGPPPAPTVSVATPLVREITDWDEYIGRFEAIQDVEVMPRVSGQVDLVSFRPGVEVGRGTVLFRIDPRPYRAALAQAQAQIARGNATLANARSQAERARKLLEFQAVSREEYEQLQSTVRTATADLAAARAAAEVAELDLSFTTVRSPINGRVSDKRVATGDYVTAGQTLLTKVVSVNPIWFSFDGAESFYLKYIRQAADGERASSRYAPNPIEIQLADESGYRWRGRMTFVDNAIDPGSGTIRAHAEVANPDGFLVPGMFGRARLLGSGTYRAMLIPDEAVVTDQTRKIVFVVGRDGKAAQRIVAVGPIVEGLRVVREGLAPTDRVVLDGLARLQPGTQVKTRRAQIRPQAANTSPQNQPLTSPAASQATSIQ